MASRGRGTVANDFSAWLPLLWASSTTLIALVPMSSPNVEGFLPSPNSAIFGSRPSPDSDPAPIGGANQPSARCVVGRKRLSWSQFITVPYLNCQHFLHHIVRCRLVSPPTYGVSEQIEWFSLFPFGLEQAG